MAAPDNASWARCPTGAVRALCRPMPRRAKADSSTPTTATSAASGQKKAMHKTMTQNLQIAVDDRIHHLHALQLQGTQLRGQSSQNVAQVILGEIPQGNPFEQVTQFQSLLRPPALFRYSPGAGFSSKHTQSAERSAG